MMERRQKSALRARSMTLADELIMDDDLYGALKQHKVFTESMLQIIKEVKKPKGQVYKLLELLEKRGPQAFNKFVEILDENYDWLANELRETYNQKMLEGHSKHRHMSELTPRKETRTTTALSASAVPRLQFKTPPRTSQSLPFQASLQGDQDSGRDYPDNGGEPIQSLPADLDNVSGAGSDYDQSDHESNPDVTILDEDDDGAFQSEETINEASEEDIDISPSHEKSECEQSRKEDKVYKDQCLSPINIIGATIKTANAQCSPILVDKLDSVLGVDEPDGYCRIQDKPKQEEGAIAQPKGSDIVAGAEHDSCNFNQHTASDQEDMTDDEEELAPSEVFYDKMRRKSGLFEMDLVALNLAMQDGQNRQDDVNDSFFKHEEENEIREIYVECLKGVIYNSEGKDRDKEQMIHDRLENIDTIGITFAMIKDQVDELVRMVEEKKKTIDKALVKFENRDKKVSLEVCIEKEKEEKKQLKERLMEEIRKVNEMANDMYQHSQDMKTVEKLKNRLGMLERENDALKGKNAQLEQNYMESQRDFERTKRDLDTVLAAEDKRQSKKQAPPRRQPAVSPRRGSSYQTSRIYQPYNHGQSPRNPGAVVQPWRASGTTKK